MAKDQRRSEHRPEQIVRMAAGPSATIVGQAYQHRGPLPAPVDFRAYDEVVPGSAERILKMAEGETSHRRAMEDRALRAEAMQAILGQCFGFLLGLSGIGGGILAIYLNQSLAGWASIIGAMAALATVFVVSHRRPPP